MMVLLTLLDNSPRVMVTILGGLILLMLGQEMLDGALIIF